MTTTPQLLPYLERLLDGETVEWKTLGEICEKVCSGGTPLTSHSKYYEGNIPWLRTQDIDWQEVHDTEIKITEEAIANSSAKLIPKNCVIVAMYGATAAKACINKIPLTTNQACCNLQIDEKQAHYKYAYYWICNEYERLRAQGEGSQSNLNAKKIKSYPIPVPPLRVQARIVDILDKFTQLEAELEAELEARKKQYAYYRDQLLKFSQYPPLNVNVEWKTLGEVAEYVRQRVAVDQLCAQTFVGVDNLLPNRAGKQDSNYLPSEGNAIAYQPNDILIGNIRPYLKKIWKADNEGGASADVLVVRITNSLLTPGYLYHLLADDCFFSYDMQHAKGAKMPRGNKEKILDYVLPLPPLSEQRRIVEILDRFDTLTNSISEGLPREIALRRKQYEYYRDALLRFPPPAPTA